jgi:hypothetical protein
MSETPIPTLKDVLAARLNVYRYLKPTALHYYPGLSDLVGAQVGSSTRITSRWGPSKCAAGSTWPPI